MNIRIAKRLHPFTHETGRKFLLPRTSWAIRVFPTRLEFSDLKEMEEPFFLDLDVKGPVKKFTAELDLDLGVLHVFGMSLAGYVHYHLSAQKDGIWLTVEKIPSKQLVCYDSKLQKKHLLSKGERVLVCPLHLKERDETKERLSLGVHKAADWDLIKRRLDLKEIFPYWMALGDLIPHQFCDVTACNFSLLSYCRQIIEQREKQNVLEAFERLFLVSFEGILVPRFKDTDYQGISPQDALVSFSPLPLLTEGARLIRSLFVQESQGEIHLLPCLPQEFHCGRFLHVRTAQGAFLDIEWSKKTLKRVFVTPAIHAEAIVLKFPKGIRSFRLTSGKTVLKKVEVDLQGRATLPSGFGRALLLDRFTY